MLSVAAAFQAARTNKADPHRSAIGKEGKNGDFLYNFDRLFETRFGENLVYAPQAVAEDAVKFTKRSKNNRVVLRSIGSGVQKIVVDGTDNFIYLGASKKFQATVVVEGKRNLFFFADSATCNFAAFLVSGEDKSMIFGTDCMVSFRITARTTDSHAMIDLDTKLVTNPPESVLVHPHVWVGEGAKILKGATIGAGSIVAMNATVARGEIPPRSIAVGLPAKVIEKSKGKISWTRTQTPDEEEIDEMIELVRDRTPRETMLNKLLGRKPDYAKLKSDELDIEELSDVSAGIHD